MSQWSWGLLYAGVTVAALLPILTPRDRGRPHAEEVILYLVRERWHTGILLPSELAARCIPEVAHLPPTPWVDIGWGEADFYQTPGFELGRALKAILRWNESVVRLAAVPADLQRYYGRTAWLLPLCLDSTAAERLCTFIRHTFRRDSAGKASLSSVQAGGWVHFYKARYTYWGLQTCNTWVARALNEAGIRLPWQGIVIAEQLFAAVQPYRCQAKETLNAFTQPPALRQSPLPAAP